MLLLYKPNTGETCDTSTVVQHDTLAVRYLWNPANHLFAYCYRLSFLHY